jgi:ketosteroid isomerase-like protein
VPPVPVVQRWFAALAAGRVGEARACWYPEGTWHVLDASPLQGDYDVPGYLAMLRGFLAEDGEGYAFAVEELRPHGDLVVGFVRSSSPQLGTTRALMVFRLRDGRIAEGWALARGADAELPW